MNVTALSDLLQSPHEGYAFELKRRLPTRRQHVRTLSAFGNGRGGTLVVGVTDDGRLVGVSRARAVAARLRAEVAAHVRPELQATIQPVTINGTELVVAQVPPGSDGPYEAELPDGRWRCYIREGDRTVPVARSVAAAVTRPEVDRVSRDARTNDVLRLLAGQRDATLAEVAAALNISARRATRILVSLVRAGLAVRHDESRRPRFVATPRGRERAGARRG